MLESILPSPMTLTALLVILFSAIVLGVLNALVFSYKSRHSASLSIALALLPLAVSVVIMMVNGNVGAGVAVAGAFTLVRFRSAPGTAREIAAIFIDMAIGLALGMGYLAIAVILFIFAAGLTIVLTNIRFGDVATNEKRMKITIPENCDYNMLFNDVFEKYNVRAKLERVKTTNMGTLFELTYELVFPGSRVDKEFLDELRVRNGNLSIMIGMPTDKESL